MTTKELIAKYRRLRQISQEQAEQFVAQHQDNELFASLIEFQKMLIPALVDAFEARFESIQNIAHESDSAIKQALNQSLHDAIIDELAHKDVIRPD